MDRPAPRAAAWTGRFQASFTNGLRARGSGAGKLVAICIGMFSRLLSDARGGSFAEYVIVVGVVGLVVAAALVSRGGTALTDYASSRDLLLLPSM